MKYTWLLLIFVAVSVHAYQAGQVNRTNFTGNQQPQNAQSNNFRAFSNYNKRNWSRGVQTQTVQTEVAGTSSVDFDKNTPQKLVAKTQAASSSANPKPAKPQAPAAAQPQQKPNTPANMDPAAMMQQVQGMMNAMGGSGAKPGQSSAGQNNASSPAAMPDISALMGGAMPVAPATPAKK